jgi:predicted RNase H-like nuclease (RuvC/YqgF family)
MIAQYGRPLIIATDVHPMPGTVEKIRRSFNAIAGEPDGSLITEEKTKLAREYGYKNDHERDALGAAAHVFRRYKNKFDLIHKRALPGIDVDEAIALVMKGDTIDSAFSKLTSQDVLTKQEMEQGCITESDEKITELNETIKRQRETIDRLSTYLEEKKSEVKNHKRIISNREKKIRSLTNGTYAQLRKTKEIRIREERIRQLEKAIKEKDKKIEELSSLVDELRRVRSLEIRGHTVPVKVVPSFTREAIISIKELYGLNPGDVLFFKDASGLQRRDGS